jgi:hypothetical protein
MILTLWVWILLRDIGFSPVDEIVGTKALCLSRCQHVKEPLLLQLITAMHSSKFAALLLVMTTVTEKLKKLLINEQKNEQTLSFCFCPQCSVLLQTDPRLREFKVSCHAWPPTDPEYVCSDLHQLSAGKLWGEYVSTLTACWETLRWVCMSTPTACWETLRWVCLSTPTACWETLRWVCMSTPTACWDILRWVCLSTPTAC